MLKRVKTIMLIIFAIISISFTTVQANVVEYRGKQEGLISTPNDFFLNLGQLLPGDIKEGKAYIRNTTDDEIEVFFKTEPLGKEEYYDEIDYSLLEKIKLTINLKKSGNNSEESVYEGNLGAELMSEYVSLGKFQKGFDGEFLFKIEVPTELRNNYTLSTTKVKWVFAVGNDEEPIEPEEPTNPEKPVEPEVPTEPEKPTTPEKPSKPENQNGTIATGDYIFYAVGIILLVIIINIIFIVVIKRRKNDEK